VLSRLLYLAAVRAAVRWSNRLSSSIDVHRLELYEKLGLPRPTDPDVERAIADAVNLLRFGWGPRI
jgi:hypothetical protein